MEARVDKPVFIPVSPNYVITVLLEYSNWTYTVPRSRRVERLTGERWSLERFPGAYYWFDESGMPVYVTGGVTRESKSDFERGEVKIWIRYTDFNYPDNSFIREIMKEDALEEWKRSFEELKKWIVGRIIQIANEEFEWGTLKYFEERYGIKEEVGE